MADKMLTRIEAKLDALLDKLNVEYKEPAVKPPKPTKLTAEEQQAIDNAPETPAGANEPALMGARTDAINNAPLTPATSPHATGGKKPGK